ncbi:maleylpyruvate isomerase family mycothiol-dependent enzyme [Nocardia donostiensis]|nr:maleylpyruvate isomerase family mycothiol-dependent enzyme [Nocardia donostiensis]
MTSDATETTDQQLVEVMAATERLLRTVDTLDDDALRELSLLPGWTRGHVLAHLSRNADSLVNLLLWARTGVETPQYASAFLRDSDIEEGAPRPLSEQRADLVESTGRLVGLAQTLSVQQWNAEVRTRQGRPIPASQIPWMRWQELEIHHVDLNAGYSPSDWPADFVARILPDVAADLGRSVTESFEIRSVDTGFTAVLGSGTPERTIAAPASDLLAWLIGRGASADFPAALPELPSWR